MTNTTRAYFEVFIAPKILADYNLPQALHRFDNGDYENDWIQVAWRSYEAGAQAETKVAQGKRQPLTDNEIEEVWEAQQFNIVDFQLARDFARDLEEAHGITATPQGKL